MIIGIGCDVVEHDTTRDLGWSSNPVRLQRIFSTQELAMLDDHKTDRFLSGRFAAKEAVLKCLGTGMKDGISLKDVQILQTEAGRPIIQIEGETQKLALQMGIANWHISISHSSHNSTAFVVAES